MNPYEKKSQEFHQAFDKIFDRPMTAELLQLRKTLIAEEVKELFSEIDLATEELKSGAVKKETLMNLMKELADVQYVLSGTSVVFGLPMSDVYQRVHDSNMSKLDANGKPVIRADGKILKGPNYKSPDLGDLADDVLARQTCSLKKAG